MTGDPSLGAPADVDRLQAALDQVVAASTADETEIAVLARAGEYTRFAGDVVHQPQDITEAQFLVRAVVDGHPYRTATTVLRRLADAVAAADAGAQHAARQASQPGRVTLARPDRPSGSSRRSLWHADVEAFDTGARVSLARAAMRSAQRAGGQAAGMLGRAVTRQAVVTSTGIRRHTAATETSGSLTVTIADGSSHWVDLGRSATGLGVSIAVDRAVAEAAAGAGRVPVSPGSYQVVLGAEAVGEMLQFLPDIGFAGDLAADGIGVCVTAAGQQLAAGCIDVADDATADVGLPLDFDIEGVSKRRVPLLAAGRVGAPVTDLAVAARLGSSSTGHAHIAREQVPAPQAANIVMAAGTHTESDLIAGVERGIYLQRFWYTRLVDRAASLITGVTRDACFLIADGALGQPVDGVRFTQSVLGFLATVDAVGREVRSQPVMNVWNGATSAPAVRGARFRLGAAQHPRP